MQDLRLPVGLRIPRLVAVGVNAGLALGSLGLWIVAYVQQLTWRADFTAFYTGWSLVANGLGQRLYDYRLQMVTQQQILGGGYLAGGLLPFNYPPHVALLFAPIALLPLDSAYLVWSVLQLSVLTWLCRALWKHLEAECVSVQGRVLGISTTVALPAMLAALFLGAFSVFMLLGWLNFALALRRQDDRRAGLWVILLTLKPQIAVVPALVLLAGRRWKAIGVMVGGGLILVAVTALALGVGIWSDFVGALRTTLGADRMLGVNPSAMANVRGELTLLLGGEYTALVNTTSIAAFAAALIGVLWVWSTGQKVVPGFDLRMAITLLSGVLFSPHVNPQDGVLLVVPVLLFWHHLRPKSREGHLLVALAAICPVALWAAEQVVGTVWARCVPTLTMVLLGVWMVYVCIVDRGLGAVLVGGVSSLGDDA